MDRPKKELILHIGIDCAPGEPRPDYFLKSTFDEIGLKNIEIPDPYNKFFGAWQWSIPLTITKFEFEQKYSNDLQNYFDKLYKNGSIRGGVWNLKVTIL